MTQTKGNAFAGGVASTTRCIMFKLFYGALQKQHRVAAGIIFASESVFQ
jgi:hypothetical protein